MDNFFSDRFKQIWAVILILMIILIGRLFSLTVVQGEKWINASDNMRVKSIYTSAPRGEIKDRNGNVLAGSNPNFVIQMVKSDIPDEELNSGISRLISILEKNGDTIIDSFPVIVDGSNIYYTYQVNIENWLRLQEMPTNYTAADAFKAFRDRNGIDANLNKYEAQIELQTVYNIFPPISVKNMKYLQDLEKEAFLGKYFPDEIDMTATEVFAALREKFKISKELSDSEARKIMVVRDSLFSQGYRQYNPVQIATGISEGTIIEVEERGSEMPDVEVVAEPTRDYPYGTLASHVLGYLGQISESEREKYVNELKYNPNDMIGKEGIEKVYEDVLKGEDGVKRVEVDAHGKLTSVIDETEPSKGEDIYLTIDADLQKVAEDSLAKALSEIQKGGVFTSERGNYNYSKTYSNANAGAAVAIDVKTGEILAMASYPGFDPNIFATGISQEAWNALQDQNPRDPLSPLPLYNIAARTAVQPGSTFKMVVGTTAVESGISPLLKLYDGGAVTLGSKTFGCSIWNSRRGSHGYVDLMGALEVSCNYYFFDVASGYDFNKKQSLPGDISMGRIMEYANMFGLGLPTGIEIPETVVAVPSEIEKNERTKSLLKNQLTKNAKTYFSKKIYSDEKELTKNIEAIIKWSDENPSRNELLARLPKIGVVEEQVSILADLCKYTYFNQTKWSQGDKLNLAIGQAEHAYTPLQMANYIATIANDGYRNEVTLIKKIGDKITKKDQAERMDLKYDDTLGYIRQGMRQVVSGSRGTSRGVFGNFPVKVAAKTGTAEKSGKINPVDEVEYIRANLRRITSAMTFEQVEAEMTRLMLEQPEIYTSRNTAVRQAVINLSGGKITYARMDAYKAEYDNFAWLVCFAPYDDPQIAIAVLLFQGGSGNYAAPVAREMLAEYLNLTKTVAAPAEINLNVEAELETNH